MFDQWEARTGYESRFEALKLAYGPIMFQSVRVAREQGLLQAIEQSKTGLTVEEAAEETGLSKYGAGVLLEACLASGVATLKEARYSLTKMGHFVQNDLLTRVTTDFVHDVCYQGMHALDEAIRTERPAGLRVFGDWPTIYEGLSSLPEKTRSHWLDFDHLHSDYAFGDALPIVFAKQPRHLMDIGGNTGRWALKCVGADPDINVTIADLPGQIGMARKAIDTIAGADRISYYGVDLLDEGQRLPGGHDALWMSQFLVCFSQSEIVSILTRAVEAMSEDSRLYILDMYWEQQRTDIAAYCMIATSIYFTCMANGNSRVYRLADMKVCIESAGLVVEQQNDNVGLGYTLLTCRKGRG